MLRILTVDTYALTRLRVVGVCIPIQGAAKTRLCANTKLTCSFYLCLFRSVCLLAIKTDNCNHSTIMNAITTDNCRTAWGSS